MRIRFTRHAKFKITLINEHGFPLTTGQIIDAIKCPEFVTNEKFGRMGAYRSLDRAHAVRVIYEEHVGIFTVVTVMIVRRMRYER
ncbi:MAG: hypothetical protein C5S52_01905 [ANME-2 cluster archaeon]|nr:hypothetical protein [ANME-2 cluster archaeon]